MTREEYGYVLIQVTAWTGCFNTGNRMDRLCFNTGDRMDRLCFNTGDRMDRLS